MHRMEHAIGVQPSSRRTTLLEGIARVHEMWILHTRSTRMQRQRQKVSQQVPSEKAYPCEKINDFFKQE